MHSFNETGLLFLAFGFDAHVTFGFSQVLLKIPDLVFFNGTLIFLGTKSYSANLLAGFYRTTNEIFIPPKIKGIPSRIILQLS